MSTQMLVSPDTGGVSALYIWDENHPYQASITTDGSEWQVLIEHKDADNPDRPLDTVCADLGSYLTLHAALEGYRAHEWAVLHIDITPHGELVVST